MVWGRAYGINRMHELRIAVTEQLNILRRDHPDVVSQHPPEIAKIEELIDARRYIAAATLLGEIDPKFDAPAPGESD